MRRSSRQRKSSNEWNTRTEHLEEEYVLTQVDEQHIENMKDEHRVEIVELSDNEFQVDNDDIKYEYETQEEHDLNNEEYEIQEKSIAEEHEFECYECQVTFRKFRFFPFLHCNVKYYFLFSL